VSPDTPKCDQRHRRAAQTERTKLGHTSPAQPVEWLPSHPPVPARTDFHSNRGYRAAVRTLPQGVTEM